MASELGVQTIQHTNGTDAVTIDSSGNATFPNRYPKVAIIADVKAYNVDGGTFTTGSWQTRDLNTEVTDSDNIVSISSNQFTLGAGTYIIEWSAPGFVVNRHQSRLYDVTGSASVITGSASYSSADAEATSRGYVQVVLTASNTYEIQHRGEATRASNGFGVKSNFSDSDSRYTQVKITKIA